MCLFTKNNTSRFLGALLLNMLTFCGVHAQDSTRVEVLSELSIESLMQIEVTTVSKHPELARMAHATVYVVTEKEIIENGYIDLEQVMKNVPGFEPIKFGYFLVGGQRGYFSNFSRTLIMINGREVQYTFPVLCLSAINSRRITSNKLNSCTAQALLYMALMHYLV